MTQQFEAPNSDLYVTLQGIDCDGDASLVMACIERLLDIPGHSNAFWVYFMKKRAGGSVPRPGDLFLIHSNINQVRELFENLA